MPGWFERMFRRGAAAKPAATSTCRIADVSDTQVVRVVAWIVASDGETLTAPLTGRACVGFDAAVVRHIQAPGFGDLLWDETLVTRTMRATPFVIDDGSGRAHVDPRGAFLRMTPDHREGGRDVRVENPQVVDPAFLADVDTRERLEYREGVIAIGDEVVVTGVVQVAAADEAAAYRQTADQRVRICGSPERPAEITRSP